MHVTGLEPFTTHGFHVHEFGDLTNGCESTGGHFDPDGTMHAGHRNKPKGDLQSLKADRLGWASMTETDDKISLFGENTILGRGIVLHKGDIDHTTAGNAEKRVACCTIGLAKDTYVKPLATKERKVE